MEKKWNLLYGIIIGALMIAACFSYNEAMQSKEISYKVKPGDTIWNVVEPYCKDNRQTQAFVYETAQRNGGSVIHAGDEIVLVIPR